MEMPIKRGMDPRSEEFQRQQQLEQWEQRRRALARSIAEAMGQRYAPERVGLERYQVRHKGQGQILQAVKGYASDLPAMVRAGRNLIFYGTPGTGKDFLLSSLLYIATGAHGIWAMWTSGRSLFATFREQIGSERHEAAQTIHRMANCPILAISDPIPPAGNASAWIGNELFGLIDARYAQMRPVWLTLNARSPDDVAASLTAQTWDRLRDGAVLLPCYWPSYREPAGGVLPLSDAPARTRDAG